MRLKLKFWVKKPRWAAKQFLAGEGARYYGNGGTIHHSGDLGVETFNGTVVSVWFRCQMLPFHQVEVEGDRATEMERASWGPRYNQDVLPRIAGVELVDSVKP